MWMNYAPRRPPKEMLGLSGLRGAASLLVVLSHTSRDGFYLLPGLDFEGTGRLGVWLFFALSAFLLTGQMLDAGAPLRAVYLVGFFTRRAFRILPLFVPALALDVALGRVEVSRFIPAVTMQHAPHIFWTVPPEFQYYLCIPFVAALYVALNRKLLPAAVVTLAVVIASASFAPAGPVVWPYLGIFIVGSFAALLSPMTRPSRWIGVLALICLLSIAQAAPAVMAMTGLDSKFDPQLLRNTPAPFGLLWAPVLLAAIHHPKWRRVLSSTPLVWLGEISFSLYLLHPLVLTGVQGLGLRSSLGFCASLVMSAALAAAAFLLIERPARDLGYRLTCPNAAVMS
jgi:peptidoglycan/LPS O-acetylase OafA/YrhL